MENPEPNKDEVGRLTRGSGWFSAALLIGSVLVLFGGRVTRGVGVALILIWALDRVRRTLALVALRSRQ